MSRRMLFVVLISVAVAMPQLAIAEDEEPAKQGLTKCKMQFSLKTWSIGYKSGKGQGEITCDNGQSSKVKLRIKGGGLTVGKGAIREGRASFSEVFDISELYGGYVSAEAHAGASKSASAQVMTKGEVSVSLTGKGAGVDLGVAIGKFSIKPVK